MPGVRDPTIKWKRVDLTKWTSTDGRYIVWSGKRLEGPWPDGTISAWSSLKRAPNKTTIRLSSDVKTMKEAVAACQKDRDDNRKVKPKTYFLGESQTTHVTKKEVRKEREEKKKPVVEAKLPEPIERLKWVLVDDKVWQALGGRYEVRVFRDLKSPKYEEYFIAFRETEAGMTKFNQVFECKESAMARCQMAFEHSPSMGTILD